MRAALAALWRVGVTAGEGPASVDLLDPPRAGAEDAFVTGTP